MILEFLIATDDLVFYIAGIICGLIMLGYGLYGIKEVSVLKKIICKKKKENPKEMDLFRRKKMLTISLVIIGILLGLVSSLGIIRPLDGNLNVIYFFMMIILIFIYLVIYKVYTPNEAKKK